MGVKNTETDDLRLELPPLRVANVSQKAYTEYYIIPDWCIDWLDQLTDLTLCYTVTKG